MIPEPIWKLTPLRRYHAIGAVVAAGNDRTDSASPAAGEAGDARRIHQQDQIRTIEYADIGPTAIMGMSQTEFFKNLGMMGGLLLVTVYGPGFWALSRVVDLRHGAAAYTAPGSLQHISDDAIPGSH